jgi:hypothetical protein
MSIAGYFSKRGYTELRMPKPGDAKSEPLIRFDGPVLNGEKSVEQQQRDVVHRREAAVRAPSHSGESYSATQDYDPVLRAHCRL